MSAEINSRGGVSPACSILIRAKRFVAEVQIVQLPSGSDPSSCGTPGSTAMPSVSSISICSINASSSLSFRSGRSSRIVSIARLPCAV